MTLTFIQGHSCVHALGNVVDYFDEIQYFATTCLFKLLLNLFCTSIIQGRELCSHDLVKFMFKVVMCQDTCPSNYFKLCMTLHTTKLYSLILNELHLWSLKVTESWGLVQSFCCTVATCNSS